MMIGGFNHLDCFPFHIWDVILPIDELHFFKIQDGYCTTKQIIINHH